MAPLVRGKNIAKTASRGFFRQHMPRHSAWPVQRASIRKSQELLAATTAQPCRRPMSAPRKRRIASACGVIFCNLTTRRYLTVKSAHRARLKVILEMAHAICALRTRTRSDRQWARFTTARCVTFGQMRQRVVRFLPRVHAARGFLATLSGGWHAKTNVGRGIG